MANLSDIVNSRQAFPVGATGIRGIQGINGTQGIVGINGPIGIGGLNGETGLVQKLLINDYP